MAVLLAEMWSGFDGRSHERCRASAHLTISRRPWAGPRVVLQDDADALDPPKVDAIGPFASLVDQHGIDDMDEYVYQAFRAGANGFLLKDVPPEQFADGIRAVAAGDALLSPTVTRRLIEEYVRRPPAGLGPQPRELDLLTAREREMLLLMTRGQSNAEITNALTISETTVKTHVARILAKLLLRDRVQAVVYAYETGLLRPGDA
jgi:DNA-binding CsgD family transcriptional regulator